MSSFIKMCLFKHHCTVCLHYFEESACIRFLSFQHAMQEQSSAYRCSTSINHGCSAMIFLTDFLIIPLHLLRRLHPMIFFYNNFTLYLQLQNTLHCLTVQTFLRKLLVLSRTKLTEKFSWRRPSNVEGCGAWYGVHGLADVYRSEQHDVQGKFSEEYSCRDLQLSCILK